MTRRKLASAGNRTRAARVAGEHSTTEPPMLLMLYFKNRITLVTNWFTYYLKHYWNKIKIQAKKNQLYIFFQKINVQNYFYLRKKLIKKYFPRRGIEPRPWRWERQILTTRPSGNCSYTWANAFLNSTKNRSTRSFLVRVCFICSYNYLYRAEHWLGD